MQRAALLQELLRLAPRAQWPHTRIVVPHRGAQRALQQACVSAGVGLLPQVISLADPEIFAADLGLPVPPAANGWPLRAQALRLLQEAHPELNPASLIPRTEELLQSLNLLAEYGISPAQLRASVPLELQPIWAIHGQILLQLWATVAPQAAESLPAARRRSLWQHMMAQVQRNPHPTLWWGPAPQTPTQAEFYAALQPTHVPHRGEASPCVTLVANTRWEEVQRLTLWVAQHLQAGAQRVGIVASGAMAERLATELRVRFGVRATTTGGTRWGDTAAGAQLLEAAQSWRRGSKELSLAYWLNQLPPTPLPPALQGVLAELHMLPGRWPAPLALAWLRQALEALAGHEDEALQPDARVHLLPAHLATQQPWCALAVAEMVEGVWPTRGQQGGLSQAQRRALGLPDTVAQAAHAEGLLAHLRQQGAGQVAFSRHAHDDGGNPVLPSRWWPQGVAAVAEEFSPLAWAKPPRPESLGEFTLPQPPEKLSPSLLEALLGCPYAAYARRVLKLEKLPPLTYAPDLRERGTLLHSWLRDVVREFPHIQPDQVPDVTHSLRTRATELVRNLRPLERALWGTKMERLAPEIAAAWAKAGGKILAEELLEEELGGLKISARADALLQSPAGTVVIDYKTGTPPSAAKIQRGARPQLAVEGWLVQQRGEALAGLGYWHLKGYGLTPLPTTQWPTKKTPLGALLAPVAPTLGQVQQQYFKASAVWLATPDAEGAGVLATGPCEHCDLAGVCRRQAAVLQPLPQGAQP
jgi:RecB family exonuclease